MKHVLHLEMQPSELSLYIVRMMAYKNMKTCPPAVAERFSLRCGLA